MERVQVEHPAIAEVRKRFAAEIAEADANPDKWYEIFVTDADGSTHTESRCFTFDKIAEAFPVIADHWGFENTGIDIWRDWDSPDNFMLILNKQRNG
jgi:hypothetical protein